MPASQLASLHCCTPPIFRTTFVTDLGVLGSTPNGAGAGLPPNGEGAGPEPLPNKLPEGAGAGAEPKAVAGCTGLLAADPKLANPPDDEVSPTAAGAIVELLPKPPETAVPLVAVAPSRGFGALYF